MTATYVRAVPSIRETGLFEVAIAPAFDFLSDDYAALFAASRATAFQHPVWLAALYRGPVQQLNADPLVVTVRNASNGRLVMVLPMLRRRHLGLRMIEFADLGVSDYVHPVASDAIIDAVGNCATTCGRIGAVLKPFDLLRIRKLRTCSPQLMNIFGASMCAPMPVSAHAVSLGTSVSSWRDSLPPSFRKELDKKSRGLHRKGHITFDVTTDPTVMQETLLGMRDFRRGRFEHGDLLQDRIFFDFYLDVATRTQCSLTRLYTMRLDGALIAGAMGLSLRGSLLVILSGFDQENYGRQSLGSQSFALIAQHCIAQGDRELDFTIGDEPYKSLFGARKTPVYEMSRSGSVIGALAQIIARGLPRVKKIMCFG